MVFVYSRAEIFGVAAIFLRGTGFQPMSERSWARCHDHFLRIIGHTKPMRN